MLNRHHSEGPVLYLVRGGSRGERDFAVRRESRSENMMIATEKPMLLLPYVVGKGGEERLLSDAVHEARCLWDKEIPGQNNNLIELSTHQGYWVLKYGRWYPYICWCTVTLHEQRITLSPSVESKCGEIRYAAKPEFVFSRIYWSIFYSSEASF